MTHIHQSSDCPLNLVFVWFGCGECTHGRQDMLVLLERRSTSVSPTVHPPHHDKTLYGWDEKSHTYVPRQNLTDSKTPTWLKIFDCLFFIFILMLRRMGKNEAQAYHTSTYFLSACRVSISLSCFRSPTLAGAPFGSYCRDSVSCPYQWSSIQPRQRKLYSTMVIFGCVCMSTRPVPWGSGSVEDSHPECHLSG